ncbi:hypothetical protein TNCV_2872271 [Trichonephila clavipes]|nr:hypothetical protein TNCV_2872271 [Trichonephila clavipes]
MTRQESPCLVHIDLALKRKSHHFLMVSTSNLFSAPQYPAFSVGCRRSDVSDWIPGVQSSLCTTPVTGFAWKFFFQTQKQGYEQEEAPLSAYPVMHLMPSSGSV